MCSELFRLYGCYTGVIRVFTVHVADSGSTKHAVEGECRRFLSLALAHTIVHAVLLCLMRENLSFAQTHIFIAYTNG